MQALLEDVIWARLCLIVSSMIAWDGEWFVFLKVIISLSQHKKDGLNFIA